MIGDDNKIYFYSQSFIMMGKEVKKNEQYDSDISVDICSWIYSYSRESRYHRCF